MATKGSPWLHPSHRSSGKLEAQATMVALDLFLGIEVEVVGPPDQVAAVEKRANELLQRWGSALSAEGKEQE